MWWVIGGLALIGAIVLGAILFAALPKAGG